MSARTSTSVSGVGAVGGRAVLREGGGCRIGTWGGGHGRGDRRLAEARAGGVDRDAAADRACAAERGTSFAAYRPSS